VRIIPILIAIMALPLVALGQAADQQQQAAPGQNETKEKAPPKKKKAPAANERGKPQAKPETGADMRGATKAEGRAKDVKKTEAGTRSSKSQTSSSKSQTKVNVQEFKSRHREVFTLGRHPKDFFVQRFGANHFRLIGNTYFVFVDGCWVAVDVAGFVFVERVICEGDPDFVVVF
jgi:cytoskeletal protein RodZ